MKKNGKMTDHCDGSTMIYTYSTAGKKLGVWYVTANSNVYVACCDNFIYRFGSLKRVLVDGGYLTVSGGTPTYHFYLRDHLGSNRVVVDASNAAEEVSHYYPYGGLFGEGTGGDVQPYKYNGKELDRMNGLDLYDYGARHMDAVLGRFTTMDPLCEKYYGISPYAYCHDNPINRIDPDGRDEWEINKEGRIVSHDTENKEHDAFFMVDDNNNRIEGKSISFKYGTVLKNFMSHDKDKHEYDVYEIRGDARGTELYEFLSDNTTVEWSLSQFGIKGNKGLNILITSHERDEEGGVTDLISKQLRYGYYMRNTSHSHPRKLRYPSGLKERDGDIGFAKYVEGIFGKNITSSIYIPHSGQYIPFNSDSKEEDFYDYQSIDLEELIVKPN